ncbi:MAG: enoyl-CoA hydratase [Acidobacteriota bacterium]|nr:enoyl-CoA hydratase [Acidobacteriota bacterium]
MPSEILYQVSDKIATITLNRPEKLNAWTAVMEQEVRAAMHGAEADESVRVIILTGAGRGFCAGADMSLLSSIAQQGLGQPGAGAPEHALRNSSNGALRQHVRPDFQKKYSYFPSIEKPIIAAINGPAVGLGFIISLYCDLRFAAESARFGTAFAKRGLIAEYGLAWLLPRLIGTANALDMLFSARLVGAQEAHRMGLVNQVLPQERFMDGVYAYAKELAHGVSPHSLRVIKKQVYNAMFESLSESFESAEQEMVDSLQCEDFKEGVAHFVEKRAPVFTGR